MDIWPSHWYADTTSQIADNDSQLARHELPQLLRIRSSLLATWPAVRMESPDNSRHGFLIHDLLFLPISTIESGVS